LLLITELHVNCVSCREPPLTTRTKSFSGTLDYLWISRQHWQVASTLAMPYSEPQEAAPPESVVDLQPCPNEVMPSDHLAVGCEALLLPVAAS
jgi:mRNA deadenylase 3'-5' endonuclease subunit Ccr4